MRLTRLGVLAGLLLLAGGAQAAPKLDEASASAFVDQTYARYSDADFCAMCLKTAPSIFDPGFVDLLRRNEQYTPKGEIGAIDADLLCDCQDFEGLRAKVQGASLTGPGAAQVKVRVTFGENDAEPRDMLLELRAVKGRWRIHDIIEDEGSFLQALTAGVQEQKDAFCAENPRRTICR